MKKRIVIITAIAVTVLSGIVGCGTTTVVVQTETTTEATTTTTVEQTLATSTQTAANEGKLSKKGTQTTTTTEATKETNTVTTTEADTTTTEALTTTAVSDEKLYEWLLNKYRGIVQGGHGSFDREDTTFQEYDGAFVESLLYHFPESYVIKDLDSNGTPELLVFSSFDLSAAYTIVNNEIRPLAFSRYRSMVNFNDDHIFYLQGSNGAFDGVYEAFKMSDDGSYLAITDCYRYEYHETSNFYRSENLSGGFFDSKSDGEVKVDESEFEKISNAYDNAAYTGKRNYF